MKNSQHVVNEFIATYLGKVVSQTFENKSYFPDFEVDFTNAGKLFVVRHDSHLIDELDDVVSFLNADFEDSTDFEKYEISPAKALGAVGGSVKSKAKAKSSAKNGKLGGRPKKTTK